MAVLIVMGVSGSGKTTLGQRLAEALNWPFLEGDDFHPAANVAKMAQRVPLTDADRQPWLATIRSLIEERLAQARPTVISCSALKQSYRNYLCVDPARVKFIYLQGTFEQIRERLVHRKGHYMPVDLLRSQFDTLEEPEDAIRVDISQEPAAAVQEIRARLKTLGLIA